MQDISPTLASLVFNHDQELFARLGMPREQAHLGTGTMNHPLRRHKMLSELAPIVYAVTASPHYREWYQKYFVSGEWRDMHNPKKYYDSPATLALIKAQAKAMEQGDYLIVQAFNFLLAGDHIDCGAMAIYLLEQCVELGWKP